VSRQRKEKEKKKKLRERNGKWEMERQREGFLSSQLLLLQKKKVQVREKVRREGTREGRNKTYSGRRVGCGMDQMIQIGWKRRRLCLLIITVFFFFFNNNNSFTLTKSNTI
jgi:hypothetical protein